MFVKQVSSSSLLSLAMEAQLATPLLAAVKPELPVPSIDDGSTAVEEPTSSPEAAKDKDVRFWLVFLALCVSTFLSALELVSQKVILDGFFIFANAWM